MLRENYIAKHRQLSSYIDVRRKFDYKTVTLVYLPEVRHMYMRKKN